MPLCKRGTFSSSLLTVPPQIDKVFVFSLTCQGVLQLTDFSLGRVVLLSLLHDALGCNYFHYADELKGMSSGVETI